MRTEKEIKQEVIEQLGMLRDRCSRFDAGFEEEGRSISGILRLLLKESSTCKSLLGQLGLLSNKNFKSSFKPKVINEDEIQVNYHPLSPAFFSDNPSYYPLISMGEHNLYEICFSEWWDKQIVILDEKGNKFTRKELISYVAEQDGGVHFDKNINKKYSELSRKNSLSHGYGDNKTFKGRIVFCYMRQIAHEVFSSIQEILPTELKQYATPLIPSSPKLTAALWGFSVYIKPNDS